VNSLTTAAVKEDTEALRADTQTIKMDTEAISINTAVIKQDTTAMKTETAQISSIKHDTEHIAALVSEIASLRMQVDRLQQSGGLADIILQRFLDDSASIAGTVLSDHTSEDADEFDKPSIPIPLATLCEQIEEPKIDDTKNALDPTQDGSDRWESDQEEVVDRLPASDSEFPTITNGNQEALGAKNDSESSQNQLGAVKNAPTSNLESMFISNSWQLNPSVKPNV
jgi:hypothetical protein